MDSNPNPKVVAVVCSYWPKRYDNLAHIVDDLRYGSVRPDWIIILNNNRDEDPAGDSRLVGRETVRFIDSYNTECRGKFVAALFEPADYYLLLDDDTSVAPKTIETLLEYSDAWSATGYLGCMLTPDLCMNPVPHTWPYSITEPAPCDFFCGCALWLGRIALTNYLRLDLAVRRSGLWPELPGDPELAGDDILAGLANRTTAQVVPLPKPDAWFKDLGDGGQAMSYAHPDYYGMRSRFTRVVLEVLKKGGW
jgi:hypothetical protein